jgi:hypothetical protein
MTLRATADGPSAPTPPEARGRWRLVLVLSIAVGTAALVQMMESADSVPLGTALLPAGFALMAVLARMGDTEAAARAFGLLLLIATLTALSLGSLALIIVHVVDPASLKQPGHDVEFAAGGEARLSFMMGLLALSAATTMLALFRTVREALRDIIPIDPARYSHALALATAVAIAIIPLLPLFVLGRPPLPVPPEALPAGTRPVRVPSFAERAIELAWFAAAALVAAGPGSRRTWPELRQRLGLDRPPWWHLGAAVLAGLAIAVLRDRLIAPLLDAGGLSPATVPDAGLPVGTGWAAALILTALTAAGTELTFRGYVQPRLGLVLTNVVLTAPLAWTSAWPTLFNVFGTGVVFGVLRILGGTWTATAGHVAFLLTAWLLQGEA